VTASSPPPAKSFHKLNVPATAGIISGVVIIVGVAFSVTFVFMQKRRTSEEQANQPPLTSEPFESGWITSQTADAATRQQTNMSNGGRPTLPFSCNAEMQNIQRNG
jgi:hypothetical protein